MGCLRLIYWEKGARSNFLTSERRSARAKKSNNYYAFGLQTSQSWTRIDTKPNQYLYNAGSELNEATSNYEMMFRSYDPAIGRMSGVDPMVDRFASLTPYNYSFNDPVYWNDPSGASPEYEWARGGGCGCWKDKGAQDGGGQSNSVYGSNSGMYGSGWNAATYGGGFVKYGPGDGGALNDFVNYVSAGAHAAADNKKNHKTGTRGLIDKAWISTSNHNMTTYAIKNGGVKEIYTLTFSSNQDYSPYPPSIDLFKRFDESVKNKIFFPMGNKFAGKSINDDLLLDIEATLKIIADGLNLRDNNKLIPYPNRVDGYPHPYSYAFQIQLVAYTIEGYNMESTKTHSLENRHYRERMLDNYDSYDQEYGAPAWQFSFPAYPGKVKIYLLYNAIPKGN